MSKVSKLIPLSKAKTAYGLLRDVQKAIASEPKRANMGTFTETLSPAEGGPACGTVGCFAGWVSLLAGQGMISNDIGARKLLGYDLNYHFGGSGSGYVFNSGSGDACVHFQSGTPEHARAVVQRIEGFIQRNLKALKARRLPSLSTRRRYARDSR